MEYYSSLFGFCSTYIASLILGPFLHAFMHVRLALSTAISHLTTVSILGMLNFFLLQELYEDDEGEFTDVEEKPPIPSSPTSEANGGRDLMTSETEDEVIGSFSDPEENAVIGQASHIEASSASNNGLNSLFLALISVVLCSCLLRSN